jgi:hypothetical protein
MTPFRCLDLLLQEKAVMDDLPPILPRFFVPHLTDRPQDPIMDTLKNSSRTPLPQELAIISATPDLHPPPRRTDNIWIEAMTRHSTVSVRLISQISGHLLI